MADKTNGDGGGTDSSPSGTHGAPLARHDDLPPPAEPGPRRPPYRGGMPPTWHRPGRDWWAVPGPYAGIGPEGYIRSDERICDDVCSRLAQHGLIDARYIEVEVHDGDVILMGSAPDRRTKRLAEDIAASVAGVRDVHNRLHLGRPGSAAIYDAP